MSQLYVPGPVQIFVGTGAGGAYQFLGYSEQETGTRFDSAWEDVYSDATGPMIPLDTQYFGEQAYISSTLTKYNEAILQQLTPRVPGLTAGAMANGEVGTLMLTEGYAVKLFLYCPYSQKSVFSLGGMVAGYVFAASWLADSFEVPLSVRVKKPRIVMRCIPVANTVQGTSILYTTSLPNPLPSIN